MLTLSLVIGLKVTRPAGRQPATHRSVTQCATRNLSGENKHTYERGRGIKKDAGPVWRKEGKGGAGKGLRQHVRRGPTP